MGRDGYNGPRTSRAMTPAETSVFNTIFTTSSDLSQSFVMSSSSMQLAASNHDRESTGLVNCGRDDGRDGYN